MMALRPELVREPRPHRDGITAAPASPSFYPPVRVETHGSWQAINGFTDSPSLASAEAGQRYVEAAVAAVAQSLKDFHAATSPQ
jgi:creatinine amidohydrolase/Fe(II)-dependent formamide hydrolase-like protein